MDFQTFFFSPAIRSLARMVYSLEGASPQEVVFEPTSGFSNNDLEIKATKSTKSGNGRLTLQLIPKTKVTIRKLELEMEWKYQTNDKIYCNGYQSWTDSREFRIWEKMENVAGFLHELTSRSGDYTFYPYSGQKGHLHGYTYTYIRNQSNALAMYGSLNERCGYTIFQHLVPENKFLIKKDINGISFTEPSLVLDLFAGFGNEKEVFNHYWQSHGFLSNSNKPITGWTSWYLHYTKINPEIIYSNLENFSRLKIPIDVFQIDDGYQKATGDWINTNSKFPDGMKPIADAIHRKGYKAGLWLAPLICEKDSFIFKEHPDWIFSPDGEHLQRAGYNPLWSGWYYALNFYKPEVKAYLKQVFDTVLNTWGFDLVKLDFLFAPALVPYQNKSRGQMMCEAMDLLRELCGDKLILGCGVPLGPAFGKVDYCRIGNDISPGWETKWMKNLKVRERISTNSSLNSTISRRNMNGNAFFNDPDVFIWRKEKNHLSDNQRKTLLVLNYLFGGLVFTSDDLSKYSEAQLSFYRKTFPHLQKDNMEVVNDLQFFTIRFSIHQRNYLVYSNFTKDTKQVVLPQAMFFESDLKFIPGGKELEIQAYETRVLMEVKQELGSFIGSDMHIFPGAELKKWEFVSGEVVVELDEKSIGKGSLFVFGGERDRLKINGKEYPVYDAGGIRLAGLEFPS
ncbi:MAG: alpha-galactosidase [Bacteroidia bacterium]|nr:alpha-galactosidase [Bacteroidia bacterium]